MHSEVYKYADTDCTTTECCSINIKSRLAPMRLAVCLSSPRGVDCVPDLFSADIFFRAVLHRAALRCFRLDDLAVRCIHDN